MTKAAPTSPRRRPLIVLAVTAAVLLALALTLYGARRQIAREALTEWLEARGVPSAVEVEAFGLGGLVARLRVGDPSTPDFTAARAEVRYRLGLAGIEITSVRLERPVLRASLEDGTLTLGSLDPLIEEFRRRPPRPDARKPLVVIDDGLVLLATDYGALKMQADVRMADGKLMALDAVSAPAALKVDDLRAELGRGGLRLRTRGDRADISLDLAIREADGPGFAAEGARLQLSGQVPYPDLERRRGDGAVRLRADLAGRQLRLAGQTLRDAQLTGEFQGQAAGWIPDLRVSGQGAAELRAASASLGGARAGAVRANVAAENFVWSRRGGDAGAADVRLTGVVDSLSAGALRLHHVSAALAGEAKAGPDGAAVALAGDAAGRGAWTALGAPQAGDSPDVAAVKRAARNFTVAAPAVALQAGGGGMRVDLARPLRLIPAAGGAVVVSASGQAPLFGANGAAFRLSMSGGGLPEAQADVTRFRLVPGGAVADGRVEARLSIGPVEHGRFEGSGSLRIADGAVRFFGGRCARIQAERLEFGANDVERLSTRLCPTGDPLLRLRGGDWRITGRAEALSANAPFLQARVEDAAGRVALGTAGGRLDADLVVAEARVEDQAPETRFKPLRMTGRAALADDIWTSDLDFRLPNGPQVATAALRHDVRTGVGGVEIDTGVMTFVEGGLQPDQLSPMAGLVGSPAEGRARFTGGFSWTETGGASQGELTIPRLDFESPLGRVSGLSGTIRFTSLAPLVAAAGQVLHAEAVAAVAPLTDVAATFGLEGETVRISGGEAAVGGGRVRVESLVVPLARNAAIRGVLHFEGVQLHDIVEASPFGDKVEFDARVSGRVPFEVQGQRVRILGGELHAIQPGRISIDRSALTSVSAQGEVTAPGVAAEPEASADTFTDFAYQAMENLAFRQLEASIQSRPGGRLGVLFHIVGEHDPPRPQEIRLSWWDLIQRNFLGRKLPLPSGTGVNLTLDTTLNLDDLLRDYAEYQRLRSSPEVQP